MGAMVHLRSKIASKLVQAYFKTPGAAVSQIRPFLSQEKLKTRGIAPAITDSGVFDRPYLYLVVYM